jgi:lipoyl(octanoyl) transferase
MKKIQFKDLGLISYKNALELQEHFFYSIIDIKLKNRKEKEKKATSNYLFFCEHTHVITLGKSGDEKNLLLQKEHLESKGLEYYRSNRGGDITYHGPGQIVVYPIFDLDNFSPDIHLFVHYLEEAVIRTLGEYHIEAGRIQGMTGVWLDTEDPLRARKICAIGVKASRWVSMHGLAFNVNTDLSYFNHIIPCGIQGKGITSMQKETGKTISIAKVKQKLKKHFAFLFSADIVDAYL